MTHFRNRINAATKRMANDVLIRNMAVRTINSYTYHVDHFWIELSPLTTQSNQPLTLDLCEIPSGNQNYLLLTGSPR